MRRRRRQNDPFTWVKIKILVRLLRLIFLKNVLVDEMQVHLATPIGAAGARVLLLQDFAHERGTLISRHVLALAERTKGRLWRHVFDQHLTDEKKKNCQGVYGSEMLQLRREVELAMAPLFKSDCVRGWSARACRSNCCLDPFIRVTAGLNCGPLTPTSIWSISLLSSPLACRSTASDPMVCTSASHRIPCTDSIGHQRCAYRQKKIC